MDRASVRDIPGLNGVDGNDSAQLTARSLGARLAQKAHRFTRYTALGLLAIFVLIEGVLSVNLPVVRADETGTLTVTPGFANSGKTITVIVDDTSPATSVLHSAEASDFTGNPYSMPAGVASEQHIFRVKNGPIADLNGDGTINSGDIVVTLTNVSVDWLNTQNGTFAVTQFIATASPTVFTTTYRSEVVDTTTVEVRGSSDIEGFVMTLLETGPSTNIYTATLKTGTATSATNANSPTASTRPVIKVADAGIVTVEYIDTDPATLVSDAVVIDTTVPVLTVQQIPNGITTSNAQNWVSVDVTDDRSGINLTDIKFNLDVDRDGVFGESGEVLPASSQFSSSINGGWAAFTQFPALSDGVVNWYVTASDIAGNSARTDSSTAAGSQNHTFEIDTVSPYILDVILGDDYEDAKDRTITNQPNRIRVDFSEPIDVDSIVTGRFLFGSLVPVSAKVYSDLPSTVFLTYEDLPSIAEPMQVLAGAVKDLLGLDSDRFIIPVVDRLGPTLDVIFDTVITRDKVTVTSRSPEDLASPPTIEINGVTFGAMIPTGLSREWTIEIDDDLLIGIAAGDGVKNVEIAGFDKLGNRAHGGVRREDPAWPVDAHLFELDRNIKLPTILPAANDTVTVVDPVITVSYAAEASEYPGDTHGSVTVVSAKLDGFDVTSLMKATTASSWTYQPGSLAAGAHEFVIQSRDDAGNIHATPVLRFLVDPPPTPTPAATETPTPEPTEVAVEGPGETPPPELVGTPTPGPEATAVPEASVTPEVIPTPEPVPTTVPTPDPDASPTPTPDPDAADTPTPDPDGEIDVEATVQAIRDNDGSGDPGNQLVSNEESSYTIYGCGLPLANAGIAGGDYTLIGLGMIGLVVLARRRRTDDDQEDPDSE